MTPLDPDGRQARRQALRRLGLEIHAACFGVGAAVIVVTNWVTTPETLWAIWPLGGWGLGLAVHYAAVRGLFARRVETLTREERQDRNGEES